MYNKNINFIIYFTSLVVKYHKFCATRVRNAKYAYVYITNVFFVRKYIRAYRRISHKMLELRLHIERNY